LDKLTKRRTPAAEVRQYILDNAESKGIHIATATAEHFGITRQAVSQHLKKLVAEKLLVAIGTTRSRSYKLATLREWSKTYLIQPNLAEDRVWFQDITPILANSPENVIDIWQFCFTEIFNNAIDHSEGKEIFCGITQTAVSTEIAIIDDGIGIFKKIQLEMDLIDERHAILELAKGKLTTDPGSHTGQGIFFTSRLLDSFDIVSGGVFYTHSFGKDWIVEASRKSGTTVLMKLNNHTARTAKEIFDQYSSSDADYGFTKTVVPVRLAQFGNEKLISRSQAKLLLARVDRFKTVVFDFEGVETIGQSFADQIFRVFALSHPEMMILPLNAKPEVKKMIDAALAQKRIDEQNRML
jgi:anti-sigma regulatory factor (Ser/Thr protein kinase)